MVSQKTSKSAKIFPSKYLGYTVFCCSGCTLYSRIIPYCTSSFFTGQYFHEFHKKVAFRENIIAISCAGVTLLHLKQSANQQVCENKIVNVHQNRHS